MTLRIKGGRVERLRLTVDEIIQEAEQAGMKTDSNYTKDSLALANFMIGFLAARIQRMECGE